MRRSLFAGVVAACLLIAVLPVAAKPNGPVGDQINVLGGFPDVYQAGEPFHVIHGHCLTPAEDGSIGKWRFTLEIDDEPQRGQLIVEGQSDHCLAGDNTMRRQTLFNYPDGLDAGRYVFEGIWLEPDDDGPFFSDVEVCFYDADPAECEV